MPVAAPPPVIVRKSRWPRLVVLLAAVGALVLSALSPATAAATSSTTTSSRPGDHAGSLAVGTARYAVPTRAVYVSTSGRDTSSGSASAPVRTIQRGVALAPQGGFVVVRGGTYHESVVISGKTVTVQNYPGEAVWLDGSQTVSGWVSDGGDWRHDGWTTRFDHSPTYTRGAPDLAAPGWRFVNPGYPMAAHPDQLWVDDVAMRQVASRSLVVPGTFFLDESTSRLYLGSNPSGRSVRGATLIKALTVRGAGSTIRGIGIRRYSPSVFHIAAVTLEAPGIRMENCVVSDIATTGVGVLAARNVLKKLTVERSGMLGIHVRFGDGILFDLVRSVRNNVEHFNSAPVSGGAKLGATRVVRVYGSNFSGNYGPGLWEDLSVYDTAIRQSTFSDNSGDGIFLEISAKAVVGDTVISNNGRDGIRVNNTSYVKIWNNTIVGNARPVNLVQDSRRNTNPRDQAVDPRRPFPDPTMPWTLGPVSVGNNVIGPPGAAANCLLCVEDYSFSKTAEQMRITANGNVYGRTSASAPTWLAVWSRGSVNVNPYVFTSLTQWRATTHQEATGREYVGRSLFSTGYALANDIRAAQVAIAQPLPSDVATLVFRPAATERLGVW